MKRLQRLQLPQQTERYEDKAQAGARHYDYIFSFLVLVFKPAATSHPHKHESSRISRHENPKSREQWQNERMKALLHRQL